MGFKTKGKITFNDGIVGQITDNIITNIEGINIYKTGGISIFLNHTSNGVQVERSVVNLEAKDGQFIIDLLETNLIDIVSNATVSKFKGAINKTDIEVDKIKKAK